MYIKTVINQVSIMMFEVFILLSSFVTKIVVAQEILKVVFETLTSMRCHLLSSDRSEILYTLHSSLMEQN